MSQNQTRIIQTEHHIQITFLIQILKIRRKTTRNINLLKATKIRKEREKGKIAGRERRENRKKGPKEKKKRERREKPKKKKKEDKHRNWR